MVTWRSRLELVLKLSKKIEIEVPVFVDCKANFSWELTQYSDGLRAGRLGIDSRQGQKNFLYYTTSEAHPASYPMGTGSIFPRDELAGAWSWSLTSIQFGAQERSTRP
jgi:hypothetical protein